jgi:hypothetical protein
MAFSPFLTRNQIILADVQSGPGVDATPDITKAVLMEPPTSDPQIQNATTNEMVGGFDTSPPSFTGGWRNFSSTVHVKGSGTAGTAPDWDPLMRGCAMGKTVFASAVTGTAQGGATSTITLAAGASAVDNFYRGQVITLTGGTGSTQYKAFRTIKSYNGTTKVATVTPKWAILYVDGTTGTVPDNTTTYSIPAGVLYQPISTSIPYVTIYRYLQNQLGGNFSLEKIRDWRGNCTVSLARNDCTFAFAGQGAFLDDVDVSSPGTPTYLNQVYPPFIDGLVCVGDVPTKLQFTVDFGINVVTEEDPNEQNGYSQANITQRSTKGTATSPRLLKSTTDIMAALRAGTPQTYSAVWGSTAGNRMAALIPAAVWTGRTSPDRNGVLQDALAYATTGANTGFFIYNW